MGFIVGLMLLGPGKKKVISCDTNPEDRKHKWSIRFDNGDKRGYLVCRECGKVPGEEV